MVCRRPRVRTARHGHRGTMVVLLEIGLKGTLLEGQLSLLLLLLRLVSLWSWTLLISLLLLVLLGWNLISGLCSRISRWSLRSWLLLRLSLLGLLVLLLYLWLPPGLLLLGLLGLLLGAPQPMALQCDLGGTSGTSDEVAMHILVDGDIRRLLRNRKLTLERRTGRSLLRISTRRR